MKASLAWLSQLLGRPLDANDVARRLTHAGLEVEGLDVYGAFSGVVAAELRSARPHPDAAKLRLVTVWDGAAESEVVCGAPELPPPGALIAWARPGAKLPNGMTIEPKAVRGIVSPGMLCAEDELGLSTAHEGLLVLDRVPGLAPGGDVATALALPDTILTINVTPNRPDALGHVGLARELAALYDLHFTAPEPPELKATTDGREIVKQLDQEGGLRYVAAQVGGLRVGPSPTPVKLRLQSLGVRSISNLVDVTNLVMLEWSQPLHAFDQKKLKLPVGVRRAQPRETLQTLDGIAHILQADDWVIADGNGPIALAGVMGGLATEVTGATTDVLIECAHFAPAAIRRTARRLGYVSEASQRFERGVDPEYALLVARRAAQLLVELGGGTAWTIVDRVVGNGLPERRRIVLRTARTSQVAGVAIDPETQRQLLRRLGFVVKDLDQTGAMLDVTVPSARPDVLREIDLIEEIVRLRGYDKIPTTLPVLREAAPQARRLPSERVRDVLARAGLCETLSYAFGSPELFTRFGMPTELLLANPLRAELSALRPSLVPGLVTALVRNQKAGTSDVRLFEVGTTFEPATSETHVAETTRVAFLIAGRRSGWLQVGEPVDAHDATGIVDALGRSFGIPLERVAGGPTWLHPGVAATLHTTAGAVGVVGQLHPELARGLDLETPVFVGELDLQRLGAPVRTAHAELPKFPSSARDLSFFVEEQVSARELRAIITAARPALLEGADVREDFRDARYVPPGKKGMLWSFRYRSPDKTLTDAEVEAAHTALVAAVLEKLAPYGVERR